MNSSVKRKFVLMTEDGGHKGTGLKMGHLTIRKPSTFKHYTFPYPDTDQYRLEGSSVD